MNDYDQDDEISYAIECTPQADRARLTKIVEQLDEWERGVVNRSIRYHVGGFNYYGSESAGSAGMIAYAALVDAIKAVKTGREPSTKVLVKRGSVS